jgi:hypothetical protein
MCLYHTFLFLAYGIFPAIADILFQSPVAEDNLTGGQPFLITWLESGIQPTITDLYSYKLVLYTGNNFNPVRYSQAILDPCRRQFYHANILKIDLYYGSTRRQFHSSPDISRETFLTIPQEYGPDAVNE